MTTTTEVKNDAAFQTWGLVQQAQAGDAEAFGQLYDRYLDTVYRFIWYRTGSRELAEDLTADTFYKALKSIDKFQWQGRDFGAWLITIARNLVFDHFKKGATRREVLERHEGSQVGRHTNDIDRNAEGFPEDLVTQHLVNVELLQAVKQLEPDQRECIVLRFLMGRSVGETAQAMGKNDGAVKALQYRGVRALRRALPEMAESMPLSA